MKTLSWSLLIICFLVACKSNQKDTVLYETPQKPDIPSFSNRIADAESVLSKPQEDTINQLLEEIFQDKALEMLVITTADFGGGTVEEYGLLIGNKIGETNKDLTYGILLVVSIHQTRLRLFTGVGLQEEVSDEVCQKIVEDYLMPHFLKNEIYFGIKGAVLGVKERIRVSES